MIRLIRCIHNKKMVVFSVQHQYLMLRTKLNVNGEIRSQIVTDKLCIVKLKYTLYSPLYP